MGQAGAKSTRPIDSRIPGRMKAEIREPNAGRNVAGLLLGDELAGERSSLDVEPREEEPGLHGTPAIVAQIPGNRVLPGRPRPRGQLPDPAPAEIVDGQRHV